ncbi:potassium channel family protein [Alkalicoccus luteus]
MGLLIHMFFVLTAITIGFTFIYYILHLQGPILRVNDPTDDYWDPSFMDLLYFSGVTILSVGYGDFVPIGAARFFALLQATLGLLVPSAFFMTMLGEKIQEKHK